MVAKIIGLVAPQPPAIFPEESYVSVGHQLPRDRVILLVAWPPHSKQDLLGCSKVCNLANNTIGTFSGWANAKALRNFAMIYVFSTSPPECPAE